MANTSAREPVVLVTGGAGFIGTALSGELLQQGLRTIAVDDLIEQVHPGRARPEALPEAIELVQADVASADTWDRLLEEVEPRIVVVLAAETGTAQSLTESTRHTMTNVVGTSRMLDAFVRHEAMPEHVVVTSSRAVYGEGSWRTPDGQVFNPPPRSHTQLERAEWDHRDASGVPATPIPMDAAHTQPSPSSVYGSTKLAQELILRNWASAFSIPLSVLRLQNVYGPGQSPHNPYTGIVTLFHRLASRGQTLDVYEDGDIGRDFVYIDDVVSALAACIARPPSAEDLRVLDVGTGVVTTILDAARTIAGMYGAPDPVVSGKFRDGDVRYAVADITRTRDELKWEPQWTFAAGSSTLSEWLERGGFLG
ncbi:NAD-dependent epimerase/dehydratase family protein [Nocardioides pocheonensis]|jgi:dTDP-L-rhamnose 4-epimerase|uniref:SDR family NAD(P)-dependent oxidoreductase n=1 Tax=Nocardioides pocheonensis TaxID=661485 RepID=A0A3N0GN25_9ACTN|nr:SDR family NAD(P)-dependent oxidoreductase [Nocardioides pocheonensis]RNM13799.1 SDR family NAD(P)-dependent oxidoreductase [Nocardioides pocheonensis]